MQELLIASSNPGKLHEMRTILQDLPVKLIQPADIRLNLDVIEDGKSYEENARKKARAYCAASGKVTLADDSGLEVDVLGGAPGIHSARFSPKANATDRDRRDYLLEKLRGFEQPWYAHFHCSVVIVTPSGAEYVHGANCYGQIIDHERGSHGFGYDPLFFMPHLGMTTAEMEEDKKNLISHRGLALMAARKSLKQIFSPANQA